MAANLNRPVDFIRTKDAAEPSVLLVPPSAFEKPAQALTSHDSNDLKEEIKRLIEENEKLRSLQISTHNQVPELSQHGHYVNELIKRQVEEITELKSEHVKLRQVYEQDNFEWEKKLHVCEENHEEEVNRLMRQLRMTEDSLEEKVEKLTSELQRKSEDSSHEIEGLKERLEAMCISYKQQIADLESDWSKKQRDSDIKLQEMEVENRSKSHMISEQANTISRLKTYIGENESNNKSAVIWNIEKETLDNRLKVVHAEKEKLISQMDLLNVRLKSLQEILSVQENDISKAKKDGLGKVKQYGIILTRWREKVYSLLIQQKSSEIAHQNSWNKAQSKIVELKEEIATQNAQVELLQHSLKDKEAQLQMEAQAKERLEQELEETKQVAICLDDQAKENDKAVSNMKDFIKRFLENYQRTFKTFEDKSNQLKVYGQRISFAASRMDMLKSLIVRRTAMISDHSRVINDSKKSLSVSRGDEDISRDSEEHLYQELERVMRERDSLATQVRDDSKKWSKKLTETHSQHFTEISTLKKTVEDLELEIQQKSKKCVQMTEELETLKEMDKEKDDTILQLQRELARHARGTESILADQRTRDEAVFSGKVSSLEHELNNAKREHAKAVVNLRQMERNHSREMERSKDLLTTTEEHLNSQIQQYKNQLMSLEKERNMLVATLRQEGLLTKLKSDRPEPMHLPLETNQVEQRIHFEDDITFQERDKQVHQKIVSDSIGPTRTTADDEQRKIRIDNYGPEIVSARGVQEPVENVIRDLKSLTAALFGDDSDDNDDDDDNRNEKSTHER